MPNIKSAKKRVEITEKKTLRNRRVKSQVKSAIKSFEVALNNQDIENAEQKLQQVKKTIDKAVSKGVIHKNTAARKKSRFTAKLKNIAS
ncbi:30S ribosomal protein S20 [Natranaerobius trueperi]|uniref:Small ribosomal subunit protein bS20 n=1 Tax=Natranaerobius trueperi TaxID=759412 RepID=A0A226BWH3_9FIRM|nr:30S ribosomal protein S20 [Natranaerobius trueperi]OWZ83132.1 30S ribosomal protein S20 [Natranaerobius trueperi]